MTEPVQTDGTLFDSIAELLPPERREHFYRRMAHLRRLEPNDDLLQMAEAMGFLALIVRETPAAIAAERAKIEAVFRENLRPETGAAARSARSLSLMETELANAARHIRGLIGNLRTEIRGAIAVIAIGALFTGFLLGLLYARWAHAS